ncbi:hypothetical protein EYR36_004424 [Pleurotus pulmonarius]|nr:hypothetical protein EYR36_004424 [Pleurotus pulmonarius]KAF4603514.1 hypothetical protein EYR38_003927 [Pleurotus pulmonarius]
MSTSPSTFGTLNGNGVTTNGTNSHSATYPTINGSPASSSAYPLNGDSRPVFQNQFEGIVNHIYQSGFQTGNYADTHLHVYHSTYRLHAIILSRSPYLVHLMSTSPQTGGVRSIYVQVEQEPEITQEVRLLPYLRLQLGAKTRDYHHLQGFAIALGYLYSPISLNNIRPDNARAVLAAGCLLGGMEELCQYAYEACRQSLSVDNIGHWIEFIGSLPPPSDGSTTPEPLPTTIFGAYADRLREDVFHFLVVTLPEILDVRGTSTPQTQQPQGPSGREVLLQIFSRVPFEIFKAAVESPTFQIGSDRARYEFAKEAVELRKHGVARGQGAEETVVLAFGGGNTNGSAVHVARKMRKRPLWKKTMAPSTFNLFFTGRDDPRHWVIIGEDTKPVLICFETPELGGMSSVKTTVFRNDREHVASFEWAPGNHLGRASIGRRYLPMSQLVAPTGNT